MFWKFSPEIANWDQTLVEKFLGGPLWEWLSRESNTTDISQHSFNIEPYGKKCLKIFSSETA